MMSQAEMRQEVDAVVESAIEANAGIVATAWVTNEVIKNHDPGDGPDAGWFLFCAYHCIRDMVRDSLRAHRMTPEQANSPQMVFEDFPLIQKCYANERDGEPCIIAVELMTQEEGEAKAVELEAMGRGCFAHADQLRRYFAQRVA